MKLTNKVTNVFFIFFAVCGFFMPFITYSTSLLGTDGYSLLQLIQTAAGSSGDAGSFLDTFGQYGYKNTVILIIAGIIIAAAALIVLLILSFTNVSYLALAVCSALSLCGYIITAVKLSSIGSAFVNGSIPISALTSSSDGGNWLTALFGALAGIERMGPGFGVYSGIIVMSILLVFNLLFFIFRRKIAVMDGETERQKNHGKKKKSH